MSKVRACNIVASLLDAVVYMHKRNIVHRDLKAKHLMLERDDVNSAVKIIDFGLAMVHWPGNPLMTAFAGSTFTVVPEVVRRSYGRQSPTCGVVASLLNFLLVRGGRNIRGSSGRRAKCRRELLCGAAGQARAQTGN